MDDTSGEKRGSKAGNGERQHEEIYTVRRRAELTPLRGNSWNWKEYRKKWQTSKHVGQIYEEQPVDRTYWHNERRVKHVVRLIEKLRNNNEESDTFVWRHPWVSL